MDMKTIKIKGYEILVDDDDYQSIMDNMKWTPSNNGKGKIYFYKIKQKNNKQTSISLHRFILKATAGQVVDHINGNTFDNRKCNLRFCTRQQNNFNMHLRKDNKLGLKGVSRYYKNRFSARIYIGGEKIKLGIFDSPEEAYMAYCEASKKYHGDFGRTV
jgi:hypothetical protein